MSHVKRQTIDRLILEMLKDEEVPVTAKGVSTTWGEDETRCAELLEKFRKCGLCLGGVAVSGKRKIMHYFGFPLRVRKYIAELDAKKS